MLVVLTSVGQIKLLKVTPKTATRTLGMFDAITLSIQSEQLLQAIEHIKRFRTLSPLLMKLKLCHQKIIYTYLNFKQYIASNYLLRVIVFQIGFLHPL